MTDLFAGLIGSKTRIKLLVRFFFNPKTRSYLRELAKEFDLSTNAVREELNQLTKTDLLTSEKNGRQVLYQANKEHPLFPELRSMVGKVMGIDQVIDGIVNRLGDLERAYLIDDYAEGKDSGILDLILV
ncbi:MAG: winged helix-turn-helix transcriptional regulator, partial [bacterium]|nr:winged helix-turn-helix transcriptional regulator [bacterium]